MGMNRIIYSSIDQGLSWQLKSNKLLHFDLMRKYADSSVADQFMSMKEGESTMI